VSPPGRLHALRRRLEGAAARLRHVALRLAREAALLFAGIVLLFVLGIGAFLYWFAQRRFEPEPVAETRDVLFPAGMRPGLFYFAAASGDSLAPEMRFLPETAGVTEAASLLVGELARGPEGPGLLRLVPPGTRVRHAFLDESGRLYVDFGVGFEGNFRGGSTAEYLLVASLVRTLGANLPRVRSLTLTVAGHPIPTLGGHLPLREELEVSEWW
jgi:hypothetical protein